MYINEIKNILTDKRLFKFVYNKIAVVVHPKIMKHKNDWLPTSSMHYVPA